MNRTRVAAVRYLNTRPLIAGLEACAGLELIQAVPSRIAPMLRGPEPATADIGLVSIAALATTPDLVVLPVGMIGCDGPTLTVRVYSKVPPAQIARLHADTDSQTSVVLARLMVAARSGRLPEVTAFDARELTSLPAEADDPWPEALLMIGDKVVTASPPAVRYPYQMDLGEAWREETGLPFVYAVWACRAEEAESAVVRTGASLLDRQRRRNAARLDAIVAEGAAAAGWPDDLARRYIGSLLRYEVTPGALEGARRFLSMASGAGLAPARELIVAGASAVAGV